MYIESFDNVRTDIPALFLDTHVQAGDTEARARAERRLIKLAMTIEPNERRVMEWWNATPIEELGGLRAGELVARGLQNLLEKFLLAIIFGDRD